MYEDTEIAAIIVPGADGDEVALDDSQLYPPGPTVAFDGDGVTASIIPCV
jgi:hypothetical protein